MLSASEGVFPAECEHARCPVPKLPTFFLHVPSLIYFILMAFNEISDAFSLRTLKSNVARQHKKTPKNQKHKHTHRHGHTHILNTSFLSPPSC